MKQYTAAFERNREPITDALREALGESRRVLEIGSGSGQHAAWFASAFPRITWCPTDLPAMLPSIEAWRADHAGDNIEPARALDVFSSDWSAIAFDAVVTINTLHIVSFEGVRSILAGAAAGLPPGGLLFVYGPFRFDGRPLEASNSNFDAWLRERDPESGLRRFEDVDHVAAGHGLRFECDRPLPANNHALWWRKAAPAPGE